jgi:hypothetical protein
MTPGELDILKILLPADDARSGKLLAQAIDPPYVERRYIAMNKYQVTIPYVKGTSELPDLDFDVRSPSLDIELGPSRRKTRFMLEVLRGGFLGPLSCEALDGLAWDLDWEVAAESLRSRQSPNWLPPQLSSEQRRVILEKLECWIGVKPGKFAAYATSILRVSSGCSDEDLLALERREGMPLPQELKELLKISDGLGLFLDEWQFILGSRDAYGVPIEGEPSRSWLIVDLREDGAVVVDSIANEARVRRIDASGSIVSIGSLRDYVALIIESVPQSDRPHSL